MRRMYHMRSELMPYIYSSVWQTHNTMVPLNRSMFIDYGEQPESFRQPQEFTFGDNILAAPITSPGEGDSLTASQQVWFPAGEVWYDYFTGERHDGGCTKNITKPLDEFPMYVRGGHILPMQPYTARPATTPLDTLVMLVYPAAGDTDNSFELYEDDGISLDYTRGKYTTTRLQYIQNGNRATVTVHPAEGGYEGQITERSYRLLLPALRDKTTVKINGRRAKVETDPVKGTKYVTVPKTSVRKTVTIEYSI